MEGDFLTQLFRKISTKIARPFQDLLPFLNILKDNWYDNQIALKQITNQQYISMKIPIRLVQAIADQLSGEQNVAHMQTQSTKNSQQLPAQIQGNNKIETNLKIQQNTSIAVQNQKSKVLKPELNQFTMSEIINKLGINLQSIYKGKPDQIQQTFQTLYKILHNIVMDPYSLKYRTLKKNNNLINKVIVQHKVCNQFMKLFGFIDDEEAYYMHEVKVHQLIFAEELLLIKSQFYKQKNKHYFQPFLNVHSFPQSKNDKHMDENKNISSSLDVNNEFSQQKLADIKYVDALQKIIQFRKKLMSEVPKDRNVKIYHKNLQKRNINSQEISIGQQFEKSQDKIVQSYWKSILQQNKKASSFQSKRKAEFQILLKQKIHKQTIVKLKLPNEMIVQATFAPLQKLSSVFSLLVQIIKGQVYLYQAPPVKRLDKFMHNSLEELQSVPTGSFYVGVNGEWYIQKKYSVTIQK